MNIGYMEPIDYVTLSLFFLITQTSHIGFAYAP